MAASQTESPLRIQSHLRTKTLRPNDHPLHLFISRKNARSFGIPDDQDKCYLSFWTNTKVTEDDHTPPHPRPGKSSVFQRMLSNSENFPEILIPDTDEVDAERNFSYVTGSDVEIFTYVVIGDDTDLFSSEGKVELICSEEFKTHYNIQSDVIYARSVKAFPVSNVVLGVSSHEAFQWITNQNFCHRLLLEVCGNTVLIRAKDVFLAPYGRFLDDDPDFKRSFYFDIYVLECSPVQQGLITVTTEIVVTYMGDLVAERKKFQDKMEAIVSNARQPIGGPYKYNNLFSDFSHVLNRNLSAQESDEADLEPGPTFRQKAQAMKRRRGKTEIIGKFQYEVVSQKKLFERMLWREQKRHSFDPMYYIGMSRKLMLKEGLFDSSYILISPEYVDEFDDGQNENVKTERLCMVRCLGKEYDRSRRIFITPLCMFNMLKKPPIESPDQLVMKRYEVDNDTIQEGVTSSRSWSSKMPVAREVNISIIPSPNYSPRAPHEEALKHYFSCPRLVADGDVLAIRSSDDPQFWQNTGDDTENRFPCIFFKVVNIKGPKTLYGNYLMDRENTTLIQIGTEHSYIPAMMQIYLSSLPQGFWDRDGISGLSNCVAKLENFIIPHLTSEHGSKGLSSVPPSILVSGAVGSGKTSLIVAVARRLFIHAFKVNCHSLTGDSAGNTEARMKNAFNAAALYSPCILLLQNIHALGRDRDRNAEDSRVASSFLANVMQLKNDLQPFPMVVVATTHTSKDLTQDMLECFLHHVKVEGPSETERIEMLDGLLQTMVYSGNISIPYIAQRTAGFVLGDLAALVAHAKREAFRRIIKDCCCGKSRPSLAEEEDLLAASVVVQQTDFNKALDQLQSAHSDAIGAPKIPSVGWDDVGGLVEVKQEILDTIQLPLQYPEILAAGLRRSGVLLYGPPGTGKTLLAKAVATECSLNFLSVKGPELINMYVGQSEENIREVFRRARSATPCVIFFDELDSLAPNRGKSGDSGGVMDRVVSQLLAELDGLNKTCDVFVIGATNRPDLLDPALLRPGRFDKLLYLGVSGDHQSQMRILEALTRKFNLAPDFNMESFIEKCPLNLTGADLYALASDAMLNAVKRKIAALEAGETEDQSVTVDEKDFQLAVDNITPSVTEHELDRYKSLQSHFGVKSSP